MPCGMSFRRDWEAFILGRLSVSRTPMTTKGSAPNIQRLRQRFRFRAAQTEDILAGRKCSQGHLGPSRICQTLELACRSASAKTRLVYEDMPPCGPVKYCAYKQDLCAVLLVRRSAVAWWLNARRSHLLDRPLPPDTTRNEECRSYSLGRYGDEDAVRPHSQLCVPARSP